MEVCHFGSREGPTYSNTIRLLDQGPVGLKCFVYRTRSWFQLLYSDWLAVPSGKYTGDSVISPSSSAEPHFSSFLFPVPMLQVLGGLGLRNLELGLDSQPESGLGHGGESTRSWPLDQWSVTRVLASAFAKKNSHKDRK